MTNTRSGMDGEDIKSELRKKYGPLTHISLQMGLNRNAVSLTIREYNYSVPTEIRIAELLEKTPYEVWGSERFQKDGTPVKRSLNKHQTQKIPSHLRKREVA